MDRQSLTRAALQLARGRLRREHIALLPEDLRPRDEAQAYQMQAEVHSILAQSNWGEIAGYKIGCTTATMQRFLNIPNPCAGGVFARTAFQQHAALRHADYVRPGVECEIAVRLGADLLLEGDSEGSSFTSENVAPAVHACMAAIEIVDDRYDDYKRFDTPTLIADDFFDAGCVLGAPVTDWRRLGLSSLVGYTQIDGAEVGRGQGGDVMGHPFAALAWLANSMAARGQHLRRGEFVLLGSVVETKWVEPGQRVDIHIDGLGGASAEFVR
jgi:2-keto-4-pentenoate hydratase